MNAKPMLKIKSIIFWTIVVSLIVSISYQVGFDNGVLSASPVCKITCEAKP